MTTAHGSACARGNAQPTWAGRYQLYSVAAPLQTCYTNGGATSTAAATHTVGGVHRPPSRLGTAARVQIWLSGRRAGTRNNNILPRGHPRSLVITARALAVGAGRSRSLLSENTGVPSAKRPRELKTPTTSTHALPRFPFLLPDTTISPHSAHPSVSVARLHAPYRRWPPRRRAATTAPARRPS